MLRAFRQFIIKEFYHIIRDYRTLLVLFGMPVAQLLIFGYAIRTEINNADIGILDRSKDYITTEITNKILSSNYFRLADYITSEKDIETAFKRGTVKEVIVFEPDFARKLLKESKANIQILLDASNPNVATMLDAYTSGVIRSYTASLLEKSNISGITIGTEVKMLYNPELKSVNMFVPGLISLILMLVSALMTSIAITKEKELGTMEVLLVSPLKPIMIIVGKVIPYVGLSFMISMSVLIIAKFVFLIPFYGSFALFLFGTTLFILTALSLGILISTVAASQQVAMMISLGGLMMPTVLLSGFIFPVENMPLPLQFISLLIPATWYLDLIRGIMLKGVGFSYFAKDIGVLALMTVVLLAISIKKMKIRLE